jgi:hypothetical protein
MTDSGSSANGGISASPGWRPSGEFCIEVSPVVAAACGDMRGDGICELAATEEALTADVGIDDEGRVG